MILHPPTTPASHVSRSPSRFPFVAGRRESHTLQIDNNYSAGQNRLTFRDIFVTLRPMQSNNVRNLRKPGLDWKPIQVVTGIAHLNQDPR